MKKEVKSQAALEFLTTYAWAFIAIMIVIGALYYFGVFDFAKFLPQKCSFSSQFECIDYSFVDDTIRLKLVNNLGEDIKITGFDIYNDGASPLCNDLPPEDFDWLAGTERDFVFDNCAGGGFIINERAEAIVVINYCAIATANCQYPCDPTPPLNCPEHTIKGKITAVVSTS